MSLVMIWFCDIMFLKYTYKKGHYEREVNECSIRLPKDVSVTLSNNKLIKKLSRCTCTVRYHITIQLLLCTNNNNQNNIIDAHFARITRFTRKLDTNDGNIVNALCASVYF